MKRLYIFRTNLTNLESYHSINDLETFKKECWDQYLLQGLWFLENNYFNEVIIWRLSDKKIEDIIFDINGKKFIQRWVNNLNEVFKYENPDISFFRGGFQNYDEITRKNPNFFGLKLYLAAGKRLTPKYGGVYGKILVEDELDKIQITSSIPFYKTTNPNIFKPLNLDKKYDWCIISNFTQLRYKGTDLLINEISKNSFLQSLKICHIGNKKEIGISLCKEKNVKNIEFLGSLDRTKINEILNQSKFGIVNSNNTDGNPRVITEILTSGTPLFINNRTRVLSYYTKFGVVRFNDLNLTKKIMYGFENYDKVKKELIDHLIRFNMDIICKLNFDNWI